MEHLNVRLFGPFQVTLDGASVTAFHSDKVRALLAYLCTETAGPHRREKLAGLLWPDLPQSSARANLRRALASLRSAI
jgi:DNA-binding SARP family transcriptional activator